MKKPKPDRTQPRWAVVQGFSRWTGYAATKEDAQARAGLVGFKNPRAFLIGPEA